MWVMWLYASNIITTTDINMFAAAEDFLLIP